MFFDFLSVCVTFVTEGGVRHDGLAVVRVVVAFGRLGSTPSSDRFGRVNDAT
jgi:hypothetical protein